MSRTERGEKGPGHESLDNPQPMSHNMIGPMKDRGSLIQLLDAFGIEWTDGTHPEGYSFITRKNEDGSSSVILGGGDGYTDFEVAFEFDENGSFTGWWVHD